MSTQSDKIPDTSRTPAFALLNHRFAFFWAMLVFVMIHLALTFYFERPSLIFSANPNAWMDYDTHIEQTWRAVEALDKWGKSWSYDPYLLAGNPNGTIFAADNKGWELWTFVLWKLGVPKGMAFNLFILLAHLAVPWVVFVSARLFGMGKWQSLLAATMGLCLWYFDSFARWCWWCGMVAYGMSGYMFLLPLALFFRYLNGGRWWHLVLLALFMSAGHLIHPYTFVVLVFPMVALYLRAFKKLALLEHLGIIGVAAFVFASNAYWLIPSLKAWHYIVVIDSGVYAQSTLSFLFTDYLGILKEPIATGVLGTCTGFRFILIAAAVIGLVMWKRQADSRFWPFVIGLGAMLAVTYLGGYSSFFTHIQPYRHILPAAFFTVIPATFFFGEVARSGALEKIPRLACAVGGLGLLVVTGNLARDALYFFPGAMPDPNLKSGDKIALRATNPNVPDVLDKHMEFRHAPTFEDYNNIAKWVNSNADQSGRVLVREWILGEHLAWRTNAQILGGFRLRNVQHSQANLFRRFDESVVTHEDARRHLIDFAVKWVIVSGPKHKLETFQGLLKPIGYIPPVHRLYTTEVPVSFIADGAGQVSASMNRIEVSGTNPDKDVVLRYHFHETLICKEGCKLLREPIEYDPVGFIRVKAPHPRDFVLENGY
ncbi:MAG: hypothetical protein GY854_03045 [Deltaproteobacteria bacterium]|nr:hypothetical protein [Deltaproteobacteria bacterium]